MLLSLSVPMAKAEDTNLGAIPNAWDYNYSGMRGVNSVISPCVTYSTYGGNPAIRIQSGVADSNPSLQPWDYPSGFFDPETDTAFISVHQGDTVYFSANVNLQTLSGSNPEGAIIGFDYYGANGRIAGIQTPDGSPSWTLEGGWSPINNNNMVVSGESRQITISATVPSTIEYDGLGTETGTTPPSPGTPEAPTTFTAWLYIYALNGESSVANFWNIQLYVNPSGALPTSAPTAAPTATPGAGSGGGGGGGWSVVNPTPGPTAAASPNASLNLSAVANAWNSISGGGKLFLLLAAGAVVFIFAGKKR